MNVDDYEKAFDEFEEKVRGAGRLMPQARYAPELSPDELALLGAMDDAHKLTVAHATRVMITEVRTRDLNVLKRLLDVLDDDAADIAVCRLLMDDARAHLSRFEQWRNQQSPADAVGLSPDPPSGSTRETRSS